MLMSTVSLNIGDHKGCYEIRSMLSITEVLQLFVHAHVSSSIHTTRAEHERRLFKVTNSSARLDVILQSLVCRYNNLNIIILLLCIVFDACLIIFDVFFLP